jgi:hypothetical protein
LQFAKKYCSFRRVGLLGEGTRQNFSGESSQFARLPWQDKQSSKMESGKIAPCFNARSRVAAE